ncbi:hypothetical protein GQ600_14090 [Phytophthora cactorum]|nr:hypothetical protein GQ600_14090 [Phytophthora cactorum]
MSPTWTFLAVSVALFLVHVHSESAVYKLHTDSSCSSSPTIIGFQESPPPSCSAITTCSSVNIDGEKLYWDRACASDTYDDLSAAAYGRNPAFLADGSCLVTDNGASSMKVSLYADGSATFLTYRGTSCSGTVVKSTKVTKASISSHSCENGALKFYSGSATTATTATTTDGSDKTISTTTSQSPCSFESSVHLTVAITATLALATTLY